jgi:hypothetical protein
VISHLLLGPISAVAETRDYAHVSTEGLRAPLNPAAGGGSPDKRHITRFNCNLRHIHISSIALASARGHLDRRLFSLGSSCKELFRTDKKQEEFQCYVNFPS